MYIFSKINIVFSNVTRKLRTRDQFPLNIVFPSFLSNLDSPLIQINRLCGESYCLLAKSLWRFILEDQAVRRVICKKHGTEGQWVSREVISPYAKGSFGSGRVYKNSTNLGVLVMLVFSYPLFHLVY